MQNDKQQLAAMGEHLADQQPMCMAKRVEELEAQVRVMAELLRDLHEHIGTSIPQTISDHYRGCDLLDRIDAVLAGKLPAPVVPEGWKLVPVEPTREMMAAAMSAVTQPQDLLHSQSGWGMNEMAARTRYCAMLAATPNQEVKLPSQGPLPAPRRNTSSIGRPMSPPCRRSVLRQSSATQRSQDQLAAASPSSASAGMWFPGRSAHMLW